MLAIFYASLCPLASHHQDADLVVRTLARYPNFFLEEMLLPQRSQAYMLGGGPADLLESGPVLKEAFSTFLAVLVVGALPLLTSVAAFAGEAENEAAAFTVFYVAAGVILFVLGALKSCFYGVRWYTAGLCNLAVGLACGFGGFVTGSSVNFTAVN